MTEEDIIACYDNAVSQVADRIQEFGMTPGVSFTRSRLLRPETVLRKQVTMTAKSSKIELLELFKREEDRPTTQGWGERLDQLKDSAFKVLLDTYNRSYREKREEKPIQNSALQNVEPFAVDGCTFRYPSDPRFSETDYLTRNGTSKATYSVRLTAMYNLETRQYEDGVIQSAHAKDEFLAFRQMVDRADALSPSTRRHLYIGDRGFCSYNNMAHVQEAHEFFLFRAKDVGSKGILKNLDLPDADTFDVSVSLELKRSNSKKVKTVCQDVRFIASDISFDYLEPGSLDTYILHFRVVRIQLPNGEYESLATNLPAEEFGPKVLKELYNLRWSEETSFRELKYTLGTINFHSKKPNRIRQEIWSNLLRYNLAAGLTDVLAEKRTDELTALQSASKAASSDRETDSGSSGAQTPAPDQEGQRVETYVYTINFSMAIAEATRCLRGLIEPYQFSEDLHAALVPIRPDRHYPRLQTAHFRKPRIFNYRAA